MKYLKIIFTLTTLTLLMQCTPKTAGKVQDTPPDEPKKKTVNLDSILKDPCRTWTQLPNKDEVIEMHVIYRDFMNTEKYEEAFPYWQKVFEAAPRADGKRWTHFEDGLKLYKYRYEKDSSAETRQAALSKLHAIAELWEQCTSRGGDITKSSGELAFLLFYEYRDIFGDEYIYQLFKKAVDHAGDSIPVFIFNPFSRLLVDMIKAEKIDKKEAGRLAKRLIQGVEYGLAHCRGEECKSWDIVKSYTPDVLGRLERMRGFYDCEYYKQRYLPLYQEDSLSCEIIDQVFHKLRWGQCDPDDSEVAAIIKAKTTHCKIITKNPELLAASKAMETGNFREAIKHYKAYMSQATDNEKKAKIAFRIAQIYYAYLKDFPSARKYALTAAKLKQGWGEPYILIGTLYASSGPLCGSGRGWNSQRVVWPAIDKWNYAKKIDPSVAAKANKLIRTYSKYMPDVGDIHQRLYKPGQKIKVGCWINETTTIRPAP